MFNRCRIALVLTLFPLYAITRSPSVFRRNKIKMNKVNLFFGDFSEVKTILKRNVSDGLILFPLYAITRSPSVFKRNNIKMNKVNLFFGDFSEV